MRANGWGALVAVAGIGLAGTPPARGQQVLERYDPHDWTLQFTVRVQPVTDYDANRMPVREPFKFDTAAVVFPLIPESASHKMAEPGEGVRATRGEIRLNDRPGPTKIDLLTGHHSGTRLGKWSLTDWKGEDFELHVTIPSRCWKTRFNEAAAKRIGWPKGPWPPAAQSTFESQMFVDRVPEGPLDMEPVKRFVRRATNGKDPRSIDPVTLAKWLAGSVMESLQQTGEGLAFIRTGELEGMTLQGAPGTLERGRGSQFDIATALVAVYREAGLPARVVIGVDTQIADESDRFLERARVREKLRAWVEFCLLDEAAGREIWVPVDIVRMRRSSSRMPPLEKEWKYFGTHDELDTVVPFSFTFFPPTTVRSYGSPAFWGWLVTPEPPERAEQAVRFQVLTTSKRTGDEPIAEPGRGK